MKRAILSLVFALISVAALALPSTQEVEAQVRQGNYAQAETMMREVVAARPDSARAHYVYAEILAHNRNFAKAAEEAQRARQIDPALTFTDPAKFRSFEQLLAREQSGSARGSTAAPTGLNQDRVAPPRQAREPASETSGTPGWLWGIGIAALAWVAWRAFARRRAATGAGAAGAGMGAAAGPGYGQPGAANVGTPYNPAGPYNQGVQPGPGYPARPGSGMLGTGMAVAGGVAGGMLLDQMLHRHQDHAAAPVDARNDGLVPGIFDNDGTSAPNELESRPVDFGSGADWGGDAGSIDVGGSSGGGDDWG